MVSYNISPTLIPSGLKEVFSLGKEYFDNVESLFHYLGTNQTSYDASEILLLLVGQSGQYINRSYIVETLCLDQQKVAKGLDFLKKLGTVVPSKKGVLWNKHLPSVEVDSIDDSFVLSGCMYSLEDWYSNMDNHWKLMNLIDCINNWVGLDIKLSSRRHFTMCLCRGLICNCSSPTGTHIKEVIDNLDWKSLEERYLSNRYNQLAQKTIEVNRKRGRCISDFNKARLILDHPNWWTKGLPKFVTPNTKKALQNSVKFFPYNESESEEETLKKRRIYLYEYLIGQPCLGDTDMSPFSPFYGHSLEERLEMIKDSIGTDSMMYNSPITQTQWVGVYNNTP